MRDLAAIFHEVLRGYALHQRGIHGVHHWARVMENGLRIAESNGADVEVVKLFAVFHDSRRMDEGWDEGHGLRGGELARSLRGTTFRLDDARFELLFEACRLHTDGGTSGEPTLAACWDADRLDLGRVGIVPAPGRLSTVKARELLQWAHERAVSDHRPADILASWGL